MISQTWIIGKAIRALFADRVTYINNCKTHKNFEYEYNILGLVITVHYICVQIQLVYYH